MKHYKPKAAGFLTGKWQMERSELRFGRTWETTRKFSRKECCWTFQKDGTANIFAADECRLTVLYRFDSGNNSLKIDGFNDLDRSMVCERYRVEIASRKSIILYDLDDVVTEPHDCLRRIWLVRA